MTRSLLSFPARRTQRVRTPRSVVAARQLGPRLQLVLERQQAPRWLLRERRRREIRVALVGALLLALVAALLLAALPGSAR